MRSAVLFIVAAAALGLFACNAFAQLPQPGSPIDPLLANQNVFLPETFTEEEITGQSLQSITPLQFPVYDGDLILTEPVGDAGGPWSDIVRFNNQQAFLYSTVAPVVGRPDLFQILVDNQPVFLPFQTNVLDIPEAIGVDHVDYTHYYAQSPHGVNHYVIDSVSVPEPTTLALLGVGGCLWGWMTWMRRRRAA